MHDWKDRLEQRIAAVSEQVMKRPRWVLVLFFILLLGFGQSLRNLQFDPELESFVNPAAPELELFSYAQDLFGRNDMIMLGLQGDVLSETFLADLAALHDEIETAVPFIENVTSLLNAPHQQGIDDTLVVSDLIETLPQSEAELAEIRRRIENNTLASRALVNGDYSIALIMIEPARFDYESDSGSADDGDSGFESGSAPESDPFAEAEFADAFNDAFDDAFDTGAFVDEEEQANYVSQAQIHLLVVELKRIMVEYPQYSPLLAGIPPFNDAMEGAMRAEAGLFLVLTIGLIVLTLVVFFRQMNAVLAPMITILVALVLTVSVLVISGNKIQIPLILLPSFLLAITIGDAVHLLTHFYRHLRLENNRARAMLLAVHSTAIPMLLTSLTTAAGLLSLGIADIMPIRNLGVFAAFGVILAFVLTITLIPALIMVLPLRKKRNSEPAKLAQWMAKVADFSWRNGGRIALVWLFAVVLAAFQIVQLKFSHDPMNWLPENLDMVKATNVIDRELSGTVTLDVLINTGVENGAKNLALLQNLAQWQDELDGPRFAHIGIGGMSSLVDLLKETNRALHNDDPSFFTLPATQALLNEELFLFENSASETLFKLIDTDYQQLRLSMILPSRDLMYYDDFVQQLKLEATERFDGQAEIIVTGMLALMASTMKSLVVDTASTYILAGTVITLMMMLLLNSIRLGLLAMLPNIAPIVVVMGLMIPMGIALDMLTMLVATIAIGITVDNTVHFTHHFRLGIERGHDVHTAMQDAFAGAGQALFTTCIVLSAGFYVFLFSDMRSAFNLGFLSGTAFMLAMVSNFTLTPSLLKWYFSRNQKG